MTPTPAHPLDAPLHEEFTGPTLDPRLAWHAEPAGWRLDPETRRLPLLTDPETDFWQRTHYGFVADNGHFLHLRCVGDFVLTTRVNSRFAHQYDQAGLMLRVSPTCWVKTSVEFEPEGDNRLGAVVTNGGYSDWSTQPLAKDVTTVWFRVRAEGHDVIVDVSTDGDRWEQIRMAHLGEREAAESVQCGLYACSPKAAGFEAEFAFLRFDPGRLA
jgi:uncharacterized protein